MRHPSRAPLVVVIATLLGCSEPVSGGIDAHVPVDAGWDAGATEDAGIDGGTAMDGGGTVMDGGSADAGVDDAALDGGSTPLDAWTRCASRPTGDRAWAQYRLPDTPGPGGAAVPRDYDPLEDTVIDCVTGLEWQRAVDSTARTHADALAHCGALELGGYDDWRLPTTIELATLVDYSIAAPGPVISTSVFPDTPNALFWTGSPFASGSERAWAVDFEGGGLVTWAREAALATRCVR